MLLKIDLKDLSEQTLNNLVEEFVTRDGTDYGEHEVQLRDRVHHVVDQLINKDLLIIFNDTDNSCNIVSANEFQKNTP